MLCVIGRLRNRDGGFSSKYGAVPLFPFLIFRLVGSRTISSCLDSACFPSNTSPGHLVPGHLISACFLSNTSPVLTPSSISHYP